MKVYTFELKDGSVVKIESLILRDAIAQLASMHYFEHHINTISIERKHYA